MATVAAFLLAAGAFTALGGGAEPARSVQPSARSVNIEGYKALQRARETGADADLARAERAFRQVIARDPGNVDATVGLGTLAMNRHHFREALRLATSAHERAPSALAPYAVLVDAQIELGRYRSAKRTLQRMIDLRPNLASYSRVSFYRELHGDLDGAASAITLAISAGGDAPENVAYVQSLLGHLEARRGRRARARVAYEAALARSPRAAAAHVGLAQLDAGAGRLPAAVRRMRTVVSRQPLPEHAIFLGELELAAGDRLRARKLFDEQRATMSRTGSDEDVGLALLEAEHGDAQRAVRVARRAVRSAPSVHAADALGWALTRAGRPHEGLRWARRALRLGTKDPFFLARAGLSAAAAGDRAIAERLLRRALSRDPRFSVVWSPRARRALAALGD